MAIKGATLNLVIIKPLMHPKTNPTTTLIITITHISKYMTTFKNSITRPLSINIPAIIPHRPTIDPTERSIPDVKITKVIPIARIALIMGNLSAAGVNLLESIEIAKQVSNNDVVTLALENVKKGVFSGDTLTKLFLKEPTFPPTFSQLISVGEQTGNLDEMFTSVANYYEEEFDTSVDNMSSLIEPIMIVFMGVMIGGLMIAMYSPIFNVGAIIGQ